MVDSLKKGSDDSIEEVKMILDDIRNVAVVGSGIMGSGIALEFARFGYEVNIYDLEEDVLKKTLVQTQDDLDIMVHEDIITVAEAESSKRRLHTLSNLEKAVLNAQYVLEAAPEVLHLKQDIFNSLDKICSKKTILASTTSSLSATDIGAKTKHPERVIVTHYYSPPHFMPLVEVFPGEKTGQSIVDTVRLLMKRLRKKAFIFDYDKKVLIGNRFQSAIANEAQALFDEGLSPEEIDAAITFGFGRRMPFLGYFQRMDMVGIDGRMERYKAMGHSPWPPIAERIKMGWLGVKTGKGFHDWPGDSAQRLNLRMKKHLAKMLRDELDEGLI